MGKSPLCQQLLKQHFGRYSCSFTSKNILRAHTSQFSVGFHVLQCCRNLVQFSSRPFYFKKFVCFLKGFCNPSVEQMKTSEGHHSETPHYSRVKEEINALVCNKQKTRDETASRAHSRDRTAACPVTTHFTSLSIH